MRGIILVLLIGLAEVALSQAPPTIKPSPASDTLNQTAKDLQVEQKSLDTVLQNAKATLDASNKQLQDAYNAKQKALLDDLKADKKYAPRVKEIETIVEQIKTAGSDAQNKFYAAAGPIQTKVNSDKALIEGLVKVVRSENKLPDAVVYDPATQTWK
jgi:hypothetical protein